MNIFLYNGNLVIFQDLGLSNCGRFVIQNAYRLVPVLILRVQNHSSKDPTNGSDIQPQFSKIWGKKTTFMMKIVGSLRFLK